MSLNEEVKILKYPVRKHEIHIKIRHFISHQM